MGLNEEQEAIRTVKYIKSSRQTPPNFCWPQILFDIRLHVFQRNW